jgi:hypothetical protein
VSGRSRLTRAQRPRISEKAEQQAIVDLLRLIGAKVYILGTKRRKGDYPGTMQTTGIPDLYAFLPECGTRPRTSVWIEVKAADGHPSGAQLDFETLCDLTQHRYFRGTADDFTNNLRAIGFRIS